MRIIVLAIFLSFWFPDLAHACIGLGPQIPINCIDEIEGKNCYCVEVKNVCTKPIHAKFTITGGSPQGVTLAPGERNADICTTKRGRTLTYVGHTLLPGSQIGGGETSKSKADTSENCDRLKQVSRDLADRLSAQRALDDDEDDSCKVVAINQVALRLARERERAHEKALTACGGGFPGSDTVSKTVSKAVAHLQRYVSDMQEHCDYERNKNTRRTTGSSSPSRQSPSSNDDEPSPMPHIDCFGGCTSDRPRGSDITGIKKR